MNIICTDYTDGTREFVAGLNLCLLLVKMKKIENSDRNFSMVIGYFIINVVSLPFLDASCLI